MRSLIDRWAAFYGVDQHLVRGLAWQESGYQPSVVSKQGAVGVMQRPGRLRISWDNDTTLKIEADSGTQTRLLHFGAPPAQLPRLRCCV